MAEFLDVHHRQLTEQVIENTRKTDFEPPLLSEKAVTELRDFDLRGIDYRLGVGRLIKSEIDRAEAASFDLYVDAHFSAGDTEQADRLDIAASLLDRRSALEEHLGSLVGIESPGIEQISQEQLAQFAPAEVPFRSVYAAVNRTAAGPVGKPF